MNLNFKATATSPGRACAKLRNLWLPLLLAWTAPLQAAGQALPAAGPQAGVCNVRTYGAAGDKKSSDTAAVQKAIDACAASGGGTVLFPPGDYLSGTLFLKSNIMLHLAPGATLWGSRQMADYNPKHLIYAKDADNIGIEGAGSINGQGEAFWDKDFKPLPRPSPLIELWNCRDVRILGVAIRNAPGWTLHPKNCDRVTIRGISIVNDMRGPNTDGIDPDSSRNVTISDCYIEAGDDCIVLKTTNRGGPVLPTENVTVTNCVLKSSASALKLGTESFADFRHCLFSNCAIRGSRTGIALFAKDGGTFEAISFSNITLETAPKGGKGAEWPIVIDLEKRTPDSRLSVIRDVVFSDIQVYGKGRVLIEGMPSSPLERLTLRNIVLHVAGYDDIARTHKPRGGTAANHAETKDFGAVPAALILAYARDVELRDLRVYWPEGEQAPERCAIWGQEVRGLRIDGFSGRQSSPTGKFPAILLNDADEVMVTGSRAEPGAGVFLQVSGAASGQPVLAGNDLRHARQELERK
jgi:hypothetical protein